MAMTWNRTPLIISLSLVSFFTILTLSLSAAAIGLEISLINSLSNHWGPNGYVKNGQKFTTYHLPNDPGRYPYMFSGLLVSMATFLSSLVCLLVVLFKGRSQEKRSRAAGARVKSRGGSPVAITYVHGLWAVAWTGLFGFGCWVFSNFKGGCQNVQSARRCRITHVEFGFFFFGACVCVACWAVVITGIRAYKAKIATRGFEVEEGDISIGVERNNVHEKPSDDVVGLVMV